MSTVVNLHSAPSPSESEQATRRDLAAAYRLAAQFGMDDLIYTHFSARVTDGSGDFLLNPYGLLFDEITASSLLRVSQDGQIVGRSDYDLNVFGYKIHVPFYRSLPDIGCVLHTHTRAGIAVSALKCGLLPISQMAMNFYGRLGYHDYEGNAFEADEQQRLISNAAPYRDCILRNHGLLTLGESVAEAFSRLYYLEQCCRIQIDAMASGAELLPVSHATAASISEQYWDNRLPFSKAEWPALLRRLERSAPDYRS